MTNHRLYHNRMKRVFTVILLLSAHLLLGAYSGHRIEMSKTDGYYRTGETAVCRVTLCEDGKPLEGVVARATIYWEGKAVKTQDFKTNGKAVEIAYRSDKPGWAYFRFELLGEDGKPLSGKGVFKHRMKPSTTAEAGVLFSADKIRTAVKRPDDFEAFWSERRTRLDKVPIHPEYKRLPDPAPGIKLFTVEIPCVGDFPVSGYLAIPDGAAPKSCPAYVDWASWMASDTDREYAITRARHGAIGFTPTWHGRSCNMPKEYYNYSTTIRIAGGTEGIEDREKWCFSGMFYRVMRSLDFVKSLPEWDGKTLVSVGGSLGGAQSVAAAALDKDVTTAVINVPCFCEFDGWASGRKSSIPHINIAKRILDGDRRPLETCAYYDCVNFAPMIKCEVYVCTGFADELCPPSNVFAFYNAIPSSTNKTMCTSPFTGHYGTTSNPKAAKRLKELRGTTRVFNYDGISSSNGAASAAPVSNFVHDGVPMLVPRVQKYAAAAGVFRFDRLTVAVPDGEELIVEQLAEALKRFSNVTVEASKGAALCRFVLASDDNSLPRNGQGYTLSVAENGITVASRSTDGLFNGAQTLRNLFRNIPSPELCACRIDDWPDLDRRGYFMTISKLPPEKLPLLKRTLDTLASLKMNWLLLELAESFPYSDNPYTKRPNAFTRDKLLDLLDYCRRRHISVTPTLQVWSHAAWMTYHPEWDKMKEGEPSRHLESQPCPESELAVRLTEQAINEHIDLFKSKDFFLMMDEFYRGPFHSCPKCRDKDAYLQFKELVQRFEGLVLRRGMTPIVCHDSFINYGKWNFGDRLRGDLSSITEILWWNYNDHLPENSILPFSNFSLIGHSLACKPFNTFNMVRLIKKHKGNASTLVYWYESAANGLLSILDKETPANLGGFVNGADYLWKYPDTPYAELGYDGTFEMVRRLYPEKAVADSSADVAQPLPLEDVVNAELSGSGKFPRFTSDGDLEVLQAALSKLPERFHLATSPGGKYYGLRLAGEKSQFPNREGFRIGLGDIAIKRLSFLTTTSRSANMRLYAGACYSGKNLFTFPTVAAITVEYTDGGKVSIPLKYRWSITDWNRPFGGVAMRWAVRGVDVDNNHYSFGICDFINPEPRRKIRSFHFGTTKTDGISPVILAVSAFGAERPFPQSGKVSPEAVAKRVGVTDCSDAGIHTVYGFEDGMGDVSVSAQQPLLEKLKHEIIFDSTSPSRSKVLKISLPPENYSGHSRDGGYIRLDLNMPYSVANGAKSLVIDHKIVTSAKGFSHANDYLIDRIAVFADPHARFRVNKLAVGGEWTRDVIPSVASGGADTRLDNITSTKYRKVSFFFNEVDAPVDIYIDNIGDTSEEMTIMPLWKVGTEAEPM